jgi:hypothetical protein
MPCSDAGESTPNASKVPKNTSFDAGESTQNTAKVPKMTHSMGIIRLPLKPGSRLEQLRDWLAQVGLCTLNSFDP